MSPSWNTAFTVIRHVLISALLAVSIGTVVYIGKTFTKKLEPTINNINSSFTFVKNAVEQTVGTEEQRREIQKNLQKVLKNASELTDEANKALKSLNDILNSDKELGAEERKELGKNIAKAIRELEQLSNKVNGMMPSPDNSTPKTSQQSSLTAIANAATELLRLLRIKAQSQNT